MNNKKGFTLIELLTVIAILGILVLIAAPKFLGYIEKANTAKIQTGIKSIETVIDLNSIDSENLTKDWVLLEPNEIQEINDSGKLIDKKGLVVNSLKENSKHIPLKKTGGFDSIKWKGEGGFILDGDSVYYYKEDLNVKQNENEVAPESHFKFFEEENLGYEVPEKGVGIYMYTGSDSTVSIPEEIDGYKLTNYTGMFSGSNVKKVISSNGNIVSTAWMFAGSQAESLDLTELNTSNVTDMNSMFSGAQAKSINLSKFNTSNVENMGAMFAGTKTETLDFNQFDTSNVVTMASMFHSSEIKSLNLIKFDISNVTDVGLIFYNSKATSGFARTQEDANKLNSSLGKPEGLNFTINQQ